MNDCIYVDGDFIFVFDGENVILKKGFIDLKIPMGIALDFSIFIERCIQEKNVEAKCSKKEKI